MSSSKYLVILDSTGTKYFAYKHDNISDVTKHFQSEVRKKKAVPPFTFNVLEDEVVAWSI